MSLWGGGFLSLNMNYLSGSRQHIVEFILRVYCLYLFRRELLMANGLSIFFVEHE